MLAHPSSPMAHHVAIVLEAVKGLFLPNGANFSVAQPTPAAPFSAIVRHQEMILL